MWGSRAASPWPGALGSTAGGAPDPGPGLVPGTPSDGGGSLSAAGVGQASAPAPLGGVLMPAGGGPPLGFGVDWPGPGTGWVLRLGTGTAGGWVTGSKQGTSSSYTANTPGPT